MKFARVVLVLAGILAAAPVAAQTTRVSDTFTASATEILSAQTNHTTDVGASPFWAELVDTAGTVQFNADSADFAQTPTAATSNRMIWVATPNSSFGSADYDVSVAMAALVSGQSDGDHFCLVGRMADSTHGYAACIEANTAPQNISIIEFDGSNSGLTPLVTTTTTVATNDIIRLSMRGDTIKMYGGASGTTQLLCVVDATQTATGQPGMGLGNFINAVGDVSAGWHLDNFLAVDQTGQGGDDNCAASTATPKVVGGGVF